MRFIFPEGRVCLVEEPKAEKPRGETAAAAAVIAAVRRKFLRFMISDCGLKMRESDSFVEVPRMVAYTDDAVGILASGDAAAKQEGSGEIKRRIGVETVALDAAG